MICVTKTEAGFTPVCDLCLYKGKPRKKRPDAVAALAQHETANAHRIQLDVERRPRPYPGERT